MARRAADPGVPMFHRRVPAALLALAALLLVALAAEGSESGTIRPRIVNGLTTHAYPSTGALLAGTSELNAQLACSGTMIGCDTFLTAAHCVCFSSGAACQPGQGGAPDPSEHFVFLQHAGIFPVTSIAVEPGYSFPDDDIAVVKLGVPVSGVAPAPLPTQKPPAGTSGTIVGFGRSSGNLEDYGLKRQGLVTTTSCSSPIDDTLSLCWDFVAPIGPPGDDSNTCNGDSGGPLFVSEGGGPVVAGVTSGGTSSDCLATDSSWDTNVHHYLSFVEAQGGADLDNPTCGALSQVGDAETTVHGLTGTASYGVSQGVHSFQVGDGVALLRVTMNGDETPPNDFDLYVRFGSPATTGGSDCWSTGINNWGACEFESPAAGTWHVLVNPFTGSGSYQVTATLFGGDTDPPPPPLPEGAQTDPQRQCIDAMVKAGEKAAQAQTRDASSCLKAFSRGRLEKLGNPGDAQTAQACFSNDVKGRLEKAAVKAVQKDASRCLAAPEQMPDYGYAGSGPVYTGATDASLALLADLFGADADAVLAPVESDAEGARCQGDLQKRAGKVFDAVKKAARKGMKKALAGAGGVPIVTSDLELAAALDTVFQTDPKEKIARARAKVVRSAAKRCAAPLTALSALFPAVCSDADLQVVADCAARQATCRACEALEQETGLALDCDVADDALTNGSCS